jgi:hypothetical protein
LVLVTLPGRLAPISLVVALAALLTSIVAIRTTPKAAATGRKAAIGGIVLGIVTTLTWGGILSVGAIATARARFQASAPSAAAVQFLNDLAKSPAAASADCDSNVALVDLDDTSADIRHWGGLGNLKIDRFSMDSDATSNVPSCVLGAMVSAPNSTHYFAIRMKKLGGGWKVYWYRYN